MVALAAALMSVLVACGGDEAPPTASSAPRGGESSPAASDPGTITLTGGAINGQRGKVLLVLASPQAGGAPVARACIPITSNSFAVPKTVMTEVPANQEPCGASSQASVLAPGTYTLTAGVYAPPSQKADRESSQTIEVSISGATVVLDVAAISG
jgi:hypothetical protein